ncbi:MAG: M15 family metallopeptidase [Eubacteriaceae bacterium]|nr:M15 family metallopeptidase [Eubacteriaceae bacterium]
MGYKRSSKNSGVISIAMPFLFVAVLMSLGVGVFQLMKASGKPDQPQGQVSQNTPPQNTGNTHPPDTLSSMKRIDDFLAANGSKIKKVESTEIVATNETPRAVAGGVISFRAKITGTGSDGSSLAEYYSNVDITESPGIIILRQGCAAIPVSDKTPKMLEIKANFFGIERSFSYSILFQNQAESNELILVNRYTKNLGEQFMPESFYPSSAFQLESAAGAALSQLLEAAASDGASFYSASAYRSYSLQETLYDRAIINHGKNQRSSAPPGHSEHQTGLAVDFTTNALNGSLLEEFDQTDAYEWLQENASDYGFILRYSKDNIDVTGYIYEPWHFRYIGKAAAGQYIAEGWESLDEYLSIPR